MEYLNEEMDKLNVYLGHYEKRKIFEMLRVVDVRTEFMNQTWQKTKANKEVHKSVYGCRVSFNGMT